MTNQRITIDENDAMLRYLVRDGQARVFFCRTTQMTQQAADTHLASDVATAAMGRFLSGAAVLGAMEKDANTSITVAADGGGAGGRMTAVVRGGEIKITVERPQAQLPTLNGRQDVGGYIGKDGRLTVVRDYGTGELHIGISAGLRRTGRTSCPVLHRVRAGALAGCAGCFKTRWRGAVRRRHCHPCHARMHR